MPKILLTGVVDTNANIQFDLAGDRLTRDQDIFTTRSHFHYVSLHFLAQNLSTPCVVLEHPTMDDLEYELRNDYDFVGVNFTMTNIVEMLKMSDLIRRTAPSTKIVLGGYGTSCFRTIFQGREEMLKVADHICYGEGVTFLRKVLGEPLDAPIVQPLGPRGSADLPWMEPYPSGSGGHVISGLGCPNMCEFCSTSFFYGGEFIELAKADRLFEGMKRHKLQQPDDRSTIGIFDENLYKDKPKVSRLGQLIREDEEFGLGTINYFSFGTIEDLSRYDVVEDLVMNGVGSIWIGVESQFSKLKKRQGRDVKEVFDDLHAHGITTIGSWIGGWDFHDKENIQEDLDYFISLEPTQTQLFPLYPPPGTSLYERLVSEDRIPDLSLARRYFGETSGGDRFGFPDWKKNFTEAEISAIVESGHGRIYLRAGPSIMRALRVHLNGYEFCKNSPEPLLRDQRSELHRAHCVEAYPLIGVCEHFAPNEHVRRRIQAIRDDYHRLLGEPSTRQRVLSELAFLKGSLYKVQGVLGLQPPPEPPFRRYLYDRQPRQPNESPYDVSYPRRDQRYEHEQGVYENELKLVDRVVDLLENGATEIGAEDPARTIYEALQKAQGIGGLARLIDDLGDEVGLAKSWLRSERLKSLETHAADAPEESVTLEASE
jgi:haloalkane dehalogenase